MTRSVSDAAPLAVLLYCGYRSLDLASAWMRSPYDALGWLAALVWAVPVLVACVRAGLGHGTLWASALALLLTLFGSAGSLRVLHHAGLAVAAAALLPLTPRSAVWLGCSLSWMPVFGWLGKDLDPVAVAVLRLALSAAGTAVVLAGRDAKGVPA
jgi:hypothetical protein